MQVLYLSQLWFEKTSTCYTCIYTSEISQTALLLWNHTYTCNVNAYGKCDNSNVAKSKVYAYVYGVAWYIIYVFIHTLFMSLRSRRRCNWWNLRYRNIISVCLSRLPVCVYVRFRNLANISYGSWHLLDFIEFINKFPRDSSMSRWCSAVCRDRLTLSFMFRLLW